MNFIKFILGIVFLLGFGHESKAQTKNDFNWILGYPPNKQDEYFGGGKN